MTSKRKGKTYRTSRLRWKQFTDLHTRLLEDQEYLLYSLVFLGVAFALRISDLLSIKWSDVIGEDGKPVKMLAVKESKTGKIRKIKVSKEARDVLMLSYKHTNPTGFKEYLFSKKFNEPLNISFVNRSLKRVFKKYKIRYSGNVSSHLFRKTFGYRVWEKKGKTIEALVFLQAVFGHADIETTKRYLGIEEEEILGVYDDLFD